MERLNITTIKSGERAKAADIMLMHDKINEIIDQYEPITQLQYHNMPKHDNIFYFIRDNKGMLSRVYFGDLLFARKASSGESLQLGFPLVFPILF